MTEHTSTVSAPEYDLDRLFRPQSIAIVGASNRDGSPGNRVVKIVMKHGFEGRLYPVTPSNDEVEGIKAYKAVADLPEVPDVALVITPASTVPGIIDACGEKGIRTAVVFSAGFEEVEGGQEMADQLAAAARRHGIAVLGANGQGLWSIEAKSVLTFGAGALTVENLQHSPVAIISQSGALMGAIGAYLQRSAIGCSYVVSVGNETVLDTLDVLAWIIEQEDVKVVGLYLEGLDDAHRLIVLAARARERGVQIVALKTGRSSFGQEATASHTGKIASPYSIYQDLLEQAGILVVESLAEILAAMEVYSLLPDPRATAEPDAGVSILSSSGGAGALLADHGEESGLSMARFSPQTVARLENILPAFARKENPVDLTGQVGSDVTLFRDSLQAIAADPRTEAVVIQFASSGMRDIARNGEVFKQVARETGLPFIITFAAEKVDAAVRAEFRSAGILISEDPADTMRALQWIYRRRKWCNLPAPRPRLAATAQVAPHDWKTLMDFLERARVTPAPWRVLEARANAAKVCEGLNYPLVVKALPSEAEHKTELGLVRLRVATADAVDAIAEEFRVKLGKPDMGVLVQEMVGDGVEVVLSCLRDTDFGPVLSIGTGGVAIELYRDVTWLALPTTPELVKRAISRLKLQTLLEGFRGAAAADVEALCDAAVAFGDLFLATEDLAEMEINPVMVRPVGKGLAAVDCLATAGVKPKAELPEAAKSRA